LVREWSNRISESEKLEVLVHELGHFLGAVHSPEPDSVMRAILGDKRARSKDFRIGFDPVNTMAMCLVSEALRTGRVQSFNDLRLPCQLELNKLYTDMAKADPQDPAARQYVQLLERNSISPLTSAARLVVAQIRLQSVRLNAAPVADVFQQAEPTSGDALSAEYVRHAADTASRMAESVGRRAFLLGLGIGLDRTGTLTEHRLIGSLVRRIEEPENAKARLQTLGVPLAYGKHELARHFFLAAALTSVIGADAAERACLALQLGDADRIGEFSPAAYQADLAGIVFGYRVIVGELRMSDLAQQFAIAAYMPEPQDFEGSLSATDFANQYGSVADPRFQALRSAIAKGIRELAPPKVH
jgi:hypothetical protein